MSSKRKRPGNDFQTENHRRYARVVSSNDSGWQLAIVGRSENAKEYVIRVVIWYSEEDDVEDDGDDDDNEGNRRW